MAKGSDVSVLQHMGSSVPSGCGRDFRYYGMQEHPEPSDSARVAVKRETPGASRMWGPTRSRCAAKVDGSSSTENMGSGNMTANG